MPSIKKLLSKNMLKRVNDSTNINWFPGHMYAGMQAIMGKLNTVDCIVEVHDARIPLIGRNEEIKSHLGRIKPRILVLNKSDLADLSRWDVIKSRLKEEGDDNVLLTDLSGTSFSFATRGYTRLLNEVVDVINKSNRFNRSTANHFKIMVVGIPNVGKSSLINRLRQQHVGARGEPAKTGPEAGVTRSVDNMIRICMRPPIYSLDTPGILQPSVTKDKNQSMCLALCSSINDRVLDPIRLARYLLNYLNENENFSYVEHFELCEPVSNLEELIKAISEKSKISHSTSSMKGSDVGPILDFNVICWKFIRNFRNGLFGKVMFN